MILAIHFDGRTSRTQSVRLVIEAGKAVLFEPGRTVLRRAPFSTLRMSERVRHAPYLIIFEDGAFCEINYPAEQASLSVPLHCTGYREGWIVVTQNSWKLALGSLLTTIVVLALGYRYDLPWGARVVADTVPQHTEMQLGHSTLRVVDEHWLRPSKLPVAQQNRTRARFTTLYRPPQATHTYHTVFRDTDIGTNAFASPSGDIVVTDALVKLVGEGDGLTDMLAHEAGHVEYHHGLRQVVQSSAIGAAAALLFDDVSTTLSGVSAALLTLHYSHDYERDADCYAALLLQESGLSVGAFTDMLQVLEDTHGGARKTDTADAAKKPEAASDDGASTFFSSHPSARERISALRRFGRTHGGDNSDDAD